MSTVAPYDDVVDQRQSSSDNGLGEEEKLKVSKVKVLAVLVGCYLFLKILNRYIFNSDIISRYTLTVIVIALILGLVLGLWPCEQGFSGHGIGNCQDIDECQGRDIKRTGQKTKE